MRTFLTLRLSESHGAALDAAAKASETSISGFARTAIIKALPDTAELPPLPPTKARRAARVPDPDIASVASHMAAVNRLTGAMIQLARILRESGHAPEHQAMESALRDVRDLKAEGVNLFRRLQE